jgi:hypothetical protein
MPDTIRGRSLLQVRRFDLFKLLIALALLLAWMWL